MKRTSNEEIVKRCRSHSFWTWSAQDDVHIIPISKAEGVYFWDYEGKKYLDFNSMVMCTNIGHGNQRVINAIQEQLSILPFAGPHFATEIRAKLGEKLLEIVPTGLSHFLFTLGGAEANENAIKLARSFTGRHKIFARYRSYHGATHGAIALTGDQRRTAWEPNLMSGVIHFPTPYRYCDDLVPNTNDISIKDYAARHLEYLERMILYENPSTIAAIIFEPVAGTNGILIPPEGYVQGIRNLCDKYKIVMIADEVMTGFGRTGEWFGVNNWKVIPDIMTMAKGLTSGYAPLGAVAMSQEIYDHFRKQKYQGGLTYNSHPICLAAALENIKVIQEDGLVSHTKELDPYLMGLLKEIKKNHSCIGDVRGIGLFAAIELKINKKSGETLPDYGKSNKILMDIKEKNLENGLFHYIHDNVILIIPPLIIKKEELLQGFEILDSSLSIADNKY